MSSAPRVLALGAAVLLAAGFAAANAHLVSVATGSQPGCALLSATTEGAAAPRAAKPSC